MRPLRCQPHPLYLPRPGQAHVPYAKVAGYMLSGRPRAQHIYGQRPAEPEKAESACDLIAFYRAYPDATCSPKIGRVLAALMRDFAR